MGFFSAKVQFATNTERHRGSYSCISSKYLERLTVVCSIHYTLFYFISNAFFSTQHQCWLTFSWIVLQIWLRCCLIHILIILIQFFIFSIFLSMCRSIYFVSTWFIFFIYIPIVIIMNHIISLNQTHLFFAHFLDDYFLMITWMKKENKVQIAKVQPQCVAWLLGDFLPISAWFCL